MVVLLALSVVLAAGILPGFAAAQDAGGNPVSLDVAKRVAVNHLNAIRANDVFSKAAIATEESVNDVFTGTKEGKTVYYVVTLGPESWVIVSADYVAYPIIAYSDDPVAAPKAVADYAKQNEKLVVLGGALGATNLDVDGVKSLANLPSLDELRAKLLGMISTPASRIAMVLQAPGGQVARVLGAYAEKDKAA